MSSFDLMSNLQDAREQQVQGENSFLTQDEREIVKRLLKFPEEFPQEFTAWLVDYIGTAAVLRRSQVQGLSQYAPRLESVGASESTTSTTYTNLATTGPVISGLSDGTYLVLVSCVCFNDTGGAGTNAVSIMGYSVNGVDPVEGDSAFNGSTSAIGAIGVSLADIRNNNNNNLAALYRVNAASTGTFFNRRIAAIKVGN